MAGARHRTKTDEDTVPQRAQWQVGERDRSAKHCKAGHGRGVAPAPGTHKKEWAIRNGQGWLMSWGEARCPS